jgi:hypothetical protein
VGPLDATASKASVGTVLLAFTTRLDASEELRGKLGEDGPRYPNSAAERLKETPERGILGLLVELYVNNRFRKLQISKSIKRARS